MGQVAVSRGTKYSGAGTPAFRMRKRFCEAESQRARQDFEPVTFGFVEMRSVSLTDGLSAGYRLHATLSRKSGRSGPIGREFALI